MTVVSRWNAAHSKFLTHRIYHPLCFIHAQSAWTQIDRNHLLRSLLKYFGAHSRHIVSIQYLLRMIYWTLTGHDVTPSIGDMSGTGLCAAFSPEDSHHNISACRIRHRHLGPKLVDVLHNLTFTIGEIKSVVPVCIHKLCPTGKIRVRFMSRD